MKVTLINPPHSCYDIGELSPPLGLLRLAAAARDAGSEASVIDFNLLWHLDKKLRGAGFYQRAAELLLAEDADLYGFTSMCVDSHVSLELARLIKSRNRNAITVFGGPHFSAIAAQILTEYHWTDYVVSGEGEQTFRELVRFIRRNSKSKAEDVPGLWARNGAARTSRREKVAEVPPPPAYDLVNLGRYFDLNPRRTLNFEGGRGCRFKCSFCYSPGHYGKARDFEIAAKLNELALLKKLGARHVFFVEDNFLNNPPHAIQFCRELEAARMGMTWTCYATMPQLTPVVIDWMARAGCCSLFTGVDAVGTESQRAFRKRFLQSSESLKARILACIESGISPTCAFLVSPPSHPCGADIEETVRVALLARNWGAHVRLNTLTLYNRTLSERSFLGKIEFDDLKAGLLLDVPDCVERNLFAQEHPQFFPFHSRYTPIREWRDFLSLAHCLYTLVYVCPGTLEEIWMTRRVRPITVARAVLQKTGDLWALPKETRRAKEQLAARGILGILEDEDLADTSTEAGVMLAIEV